jgi:magnesium-transporting ATPase (P-type)
LKPETQGAIHTLREAGITIVIITGDNALTGANIGFKSGVIEKNRNIMICDLTAERKVKVTNFYEQDNTDETNNKTAESIQTSEQQINTKKIKSQPDFICSIDELPAKAI